MDRSVRPATGGSYIRERGKVRRVGGTAPHPEGNRARDAAGRRINRLPPAPAPEAAAAPGPIPADPAPRGKAKE